MKDEKRGRTGLLDLFYFSLLTFFPHKLFEARVIADVFKVWILTRSGRIKFLKSYCFF
jgi:hypothetical protein